MLQTPATTKSALLHQRQHTTSSKSALLH